MCVLGALRRVLGAARCPRRLVPGARLNYAEHGPALVSALRGRRFSILNERSALTPMSWEEAWLRRGANPRDPAAALGVVPGDRVAAYLPNSPHAIIAMLATTSIGGNLDQLRSGFRDTRRAGPFRAVSPQVLFCVDGYQYAGSRSIGDRNLTQIVSDLDSLEQVVCLPYLTPKTAPVFQADGVLDDLLAARQCRSRNSSSNRCPFRIRCGYCFPRARPDCPRPSCTVRAASCWSS